MLSKNKITIKTTTSRNDQQYFDQQRKDFRASSSRESIIPHIDEQHLISGLHSTKKNIKSFIDKKDIKYAKT